jgi:hypothetical protein
MLAGSLTPPPNRQLSTHPYTGSPVLIADASSLLQDGKRKTIIEHEREIGFFWEVSEASID